MPDPEAVMKRYPHQLSGGMLQRCVIAMALMTDPSLLIMDEPTTALDVTTQAVVLDLVADLKREFDSAILYITHDLGVITKICDRVGVMYAGEFMEQAAAARALHAAAAPVHARPARLRAALRPHAGEALAGHHPRRHPPRGRAAAGLHLRAALRVRRGGLHDGAAAARRRSRPDHLSACRRWRDRAAAGRVPARGDRGRARRPAPSARGRRRARRGRRHPGPLQGAQGASSAPSTASDLEVPRRARRSAWSARAAAARPRWPAPSSASRPRTGGDITPARQGPAARHRQAAALDAQRDPDGVPEPGRLAQPDAHGRRRHHAAARAARRPRPRGGQAAGAGSCSRR